MVVQLIVVRPIKIHVHEFYIGEPGITSSRVVPVFLTMGVTVKHDDTLAAQCIEMPVDD